MSKIKNYVMDIQEQVWDFFDQDGNFVAKEVSFDKKCKLLKPKRDGQYVCNCAWFDGRRNCRGRNLCD